MEPFVQAQLAAEGITYSRYVDDMAMSSASYLSKPQQSSVIARVYGMLSKVGLKAGRGKHEIFTASEPMIVTKLVVNRKPSWPAERRLTVRAEVFQLEQFAANGEPSADVLKCTDKAAQRVGQLGRFHRTEADALRARVRAVRSLLQSNDPAAVSGTLACVESSRDLISNVPQPTDERVMVQSAASLVTSAESN